MERNRLSARALLLPRDRARAIRMSLRDLGEKLEHSEHQFFCMNIFKTGCGNNVIAASPICAALLYGVWSILVYGEFVGTIQIRFICSNRVNCSTPSKLVRGIPAL